MMAPKGRLLLAGLLAEQAEQVIATYASKVKLAIADRQEEWVLLAGEAR
jgi:ribosomal protein L11 methylase PrmA